MRGRDGGGFTRSRETTSSSSGVRPNQQPTPVTSKKVHRREPPPPPTKKKGYSNTDGNWDMSTLLPVCRKTVNLPDPQRRSPHHEDRPAQQPAGVWGSEQQHQEQSGTEVKDCFLGDTHVTIRDFTMQIKLCFECFESSDWSFLILISLEFVSITVVIPQSWYKLCK